MILGTLYIVTGRNQLIPPFTALMALNILSSVHCLLWELLRLCSNAGGAGSNRGLNLLCLRSIVIDVWGEKQFGLPLNT